MAIEITIINSPSNVDVGKSSHTFPDSGGTLGRGSDNLWILDDPNKYMSSVHAKIACIAEQYFLTDLSTNGTFFNGASEPIGNGNQINLNDGDQFTISDYEFIAKISSSMANEDVFPNSNASDPFADFADVSAPAAGQDDFMSLGSIGNDPFASGINQSSSVSNPLSAFDAEQIDPLELLDNAQSSNDPFAQPLSGFDNFAQDGFAQGGLPESKSSADNFAATTSTSIDSGNAATDSISWPTANQDTSLIPDDWDDDDLLSDFTPSIAVPEVMATAHVPAYEAPIQQASVQPPSMQAPVVQQAAQQPAQQIIQTPSNETPAVALQTGQRTDAEYAQLELKNKQLQLEVEQLKQQLIQAQSAAISPNSPVGTSNETQSVVNAMGLGKWNLDDKKVAQINDTVGLLMRETMQGMMRVLKFRKKIKEEFRINVTTIQSVENNPLKFSANIDDAMENMFIKENNAYKSPVDAVKEGFQGIAEHQVAVIAGMQAAFRGMIERFDPNNLESRFEKYKSSSLLSLGQKSKRWAAYKEYHQGLTENLDDSFQHLFGYDFVQAYEDQMQRLISERFSPNDSPEDESIN
ncbi:type VI secretion system-associated FHA domain protein TagH [Colwellia psychrerythraea]|uniref:FHA domain containing protein n=1 Tax=Colwellia psychrerythraea TaxID=28229 RepID=A0A099KYU0_COLPS|nr:type VI secretion system-associated FHA domain protein TagH [Colwellia psychrerythraea]KGJ94813.1 FHA domain containing protein [Colwellia psychrerythraea]